MRRPLRLDWLSAPYGLCARGAAPLSASRRPRVSATGREAPGIAATSAGAKNGCHAAPILTLGGPALAACVLLQGNAAEDPALWRSARRSRITHPGRAFFRARCKYRAGSPRLASLACRGRENYSLQLPRA